MHWIYAHMIGDYLIQTDWMAAGKKRSSWICAVHVLTYLIPFLFTPLAWWQVALIGLQHFAQDRTGFVVWMMKAKGSGVFVGPPCGPWSVIVTDNVLHVLWMAAVAAI
jgi:hypothetical protein